MNHAGGALATTHGGGDGEDTGLFQVCDATPGVCHNLGVSPARAPNRVDAAMSKESEQEAKKDDRPPICRACGVTMGIAVDGAGVRYVCLERGFSEDGDER